MFNRVTALKSQNYYCVGTRSAPLFDREGSEHRLRLKQQGRRIPLLSLSSATFICFWRVSEVLTARIHRIQSQRARGVISFHKASAVGETNSAFFKSSGTSGSIHSLVGSSETCTVSPAAAEAASSNFLSGENQWLGFFPGPYLPSGSSKALKETSLIVPETIVIPLDGSFAEALSGSLRMVHELMLNSF